MIIHLNAFIQKFFSGSFALKALVDRYDLICYKQVLYVLFFLFLVSKTLHYMEFLLCKMCGCRTILKMNFISFHPTTSTAVQYRDSNNFFYWNYLNLQVLVRSDIFSGDVYDHVRTLSWVISRGSQMSDIKPGIAKQNLVDISRHNFQVAIRLKTRDVKVF